MYNSINERRMQSLGNYAVILQIPEEDYFDVYNSISKDAADEIVKNYLIYRNDDGRPKDVRIHHDKDTQTVTINLFLYYTGNDHTDVYKTPDLINMEGNDGNIK